MSTVQQVKNYLNNITIPLEDRKIKHIRITWQHKFDNQSPSILEKGAGGIFNQLTNPLSILIKIFNTDIELVSGKETPPKDNQETVCECMIDRKKNF